VILVELTNLILVLEFRTTTGTTTDVVDMSAVVGGVPALG
jgi:hypothetical protein